MSRALVHELLALRLDFVLARLPADVRAADFEAVPASEERIDIIAGAAHPLAARPSVGLVELLAHDWVMQAPGAPIRLAVEQALLARGARPPTRVTNTSSLLATIAMLATSRGGGPGQPRGRRPRRAGRQRPRRARRPRAPRRRALRRSRPPRPPPVARSRSAVARWSRRPSPDAARDPLPPLAGLRRSPRRATTSPTRRWPGEMDAAFFLTRDRNFIPHEYPCRTALRRRPPRPPARGARRAPPSPATGSPSARRALDLSGFWFRPTRIAAWARTRIARRRRRRRPPPPRDLRRRRPLRRRRRGRLPRPLHPQRARPSTELAADARRPAESRLEVFFDDLAERDTRFSFAARLARRPARAAGQPFDAAARRVAEVEAALDAMHFERPAYTGGEVAPRASPARSPPRAAIDASATARARPRRVTLDPPRAGQTALALGAAEALPAGLPPLPRRRSSSTASPPPAPSASRSPATRRPADLADRIAEALADVAAHGEPDPMTALARLATGRAGPRDRGDARRRRSRPIADCWDCADFVLVPLLWVARPLRRRPRPRRSSRAIDAPILGYRYWLDEPGNDVQWYFSENHALLFHTAAYLAGHLLPDARFARSGRTGARAVRRRRARASAPGSTISSAGRWPSSTPPPTSPSTSRA